MALKLTGQLESNYCYLLEGRISAIIYRTNLLANIFEIPMFIKQGHISYEKKLITTTNSLVPIAKLIFFHQSLIFKRFITKFKRRICAKAMLFTIPRFMHINYTFFFFFLYRKPLLTDLVYPIALDIQRLSGYY